VVGHATAAEAAHADAVRSLFGTRDEHVVVGRPIKHDSRWPRIHDMKKRDRRIAGTRASWHGFGSSFEQRSGAHEVDPSMRTQEDSGRILITYSSDNVQTRSGERSSVRLWRDKANNVMRRI
jgi:hypothetical protein